MDSHKQQLEMESASKPFSNSIYPINDDDKPIGLKDESDGLIKYPQTFQISQDLLVSIVKEAEKRKFTEEVDKLEYLGGSFS